MRRKIEVVAMCIALVTLAACGGDGSQEPTRSGPVSSGTGTASATAVAQGAGPDIMITSPKHGATLSGDAVKVKVDVDKFDIVDKLGGKPKDGQGHIHFYLDVAQMPTAPNEEAVVDGTGRYVATSSTTHTWEDVAPGQHTLGAQLVRNNHRPLEPPVTAQITITVGD